MTSPRRRRDIVKMMEAERGVSFPVVFSDGETETDIGDLVVYPKLDFSRFLSALSQKIGILPGQFTVFLSSPETRQRIPVTGKVNFSAISREKNCFFLVELKRSRRERRRKNHNYQVPHHHQDFREDEYRNTASLGAQNPINKNLHLENVMLLKRGMEIENVAGLAMPFAGRVEYENRVRELQIENERYLMKMGLGRADGLGLLGRRSGATVCEECSRANEMGSEVGFHWCAYDPVTFGFRSPAGPISRPVKGSD
ncbi:hypothetical protein PS1_008683 [Malus domestica]|uniref:DUF7138 domain-containing protein n=1 Tax=Malus domestica TaxID=3750 RepID=A0A498IJH2_MALDO|nr:hypothetical protein DVH24_034824 [Malus domestica]